MAHVATFTAKGPAKTLAAAIEAFALAEGHVSALVVPWESTPTTVTIAVTAVGGEGWAIEHTNLGTVRLTDMDGAATRVDVAGADVESRFTAMFNGFAGGLQSRFEAAR